MKRLVTLALALSVATAPLAAPGGGPMGKPRMGGPGMGGPMDRNLFPPELVLMNQLALGLSLEQVASIKKQVGETQGRAGAGQVVYRGHPVGLKSGGSHIDGSPSNPEAVDEAGPTGERRLILADEQRQEDCTTNLEGTAL